MAGSTRSMTKSSPTGGRGRAKSLNASAGTPKGAGSSSKMPAGTRAAKPRAGAGTRRNTTT